VTRRHHPLLGREFEVLLERGDDVAIHLADGTSLIVPRAWTDADGREPDPAPTPSEPTALTVDAVRELIVLVDALGRR
jgi:hypothetical protein